MRHYIDQQVEVHMNANRKVVGVLKGYDPFMNVVLDEAFHMKNATEKEMLGAIVIRGNSIQFWENREKQKTA